MTNNIVLNTNKELIVSQVGEEVFEFLNQNVEFSDQTFITSTNTRFNIDSLNVGTYNTIINLKRVNDFRWINKYFESVNKKLPVGGLFIDSVETYAVRKKRLLKKFPKPFNYIYYFFDVLLTRVSPKMKLTQNLYFFLTKGKGRVISRPEVLGRLYSCGFEIVKEEVINNKLYFVSRKIAEPCFNLNPTYGLLIKLNRVGKNGKPIKVYKFRTMHPYAEYLQQYVFEKNNLKEGGKLNDDFRISTPGKILRKYWIDELPMIINLFKGEIKFIGVRPLSPHYLSLYKVELQELRKNTKPGLLPPFYADLPKTLDEIMISEENYLKMYIKNPIETDIKYFLKVVFNIVIKKARSN
ncbi:lipopolysaccharide/colanic/teichoic acid biosynthesis glycosyltransferase [Flavobacterium arsenatis]|uniref:Lipopolysaccharide/colanic/teichoic acid biosynthesis glycosyltransferase n=1 Tax=Flavobacterium arsenatis TaxID=1484332 RepID=A0ABU1TR35_9FLAO|nr:sugar transferase [Flavobacterium arsenatis]MDR6967867.1 lipopolysaccharide/colanic/teichoic acid biosynthesis glycosyltransferase [Flavobacterium arsenatis]